MSSALETPLLTALSAETWHQALSRTDGRDKLFRLLQYTCKLIRGLQAGSAAPASSSVAGRVAALEAALGTSRQIWRLFKWLSVYARAKTAPVSSSLLRARAPAMPDLAAVVADSALFAYLVADNVAFVHRARILPGDVAAASRRAARFWLVATLASAAGALYNLAQLRRQRLALAAAMRAAKGDPQADTVRAARRELQMVVRRYRATAAVAGKHVADAVVAISLTRKKPFHPAVVGVFGAFSSVVGLWQVWPRYVPTG